MSHPHPLYDPMDELVEQEERKERELTNMRDQEKFKAWLNSLIRKPKYVKPTERTEVL